MRCGSQAFYSTKSFNAANIGAWNTAAVSNMYQVCAAFGRRRAPRPARSVGARCGAALVRDGTADARAHVRVHVYVFAAAGVRVCTPS